MLQSEFTSIRHLVIHKHLYSLTSLYPSARVIGNDLSPIQPGFVAPNAEFVIEDFEEEWEYSENKFDFIHGRTLTGAVKDWPGLFKKAHAYGQ
jgi:hypothetical protein